MVSVGTYDFRLESLQFNITNQITWPGMMTLKMEFTNRITFKVKSLILQI